MAGKRLSRRGFMGAAGAAGWLAAGAAAGADSPAASAPPPAGTPVIDITDLYHPPQDPGDNVDLVAAYALPGVDLRAVVLDVTERYRKPHVTADGAYNDPLGGRDPGFIPVHQLNCLFQRDVPAAAAPFLPMRAPEDPMTDAPPFQTAGIELMFRVLRESPVPVEIVSFGSARPLAVAYNRNPQLLREKVRLIHLCAGAAPRGFLEWNVNLDVHAFVRILRSDLPVAIYPCGTQKDAFDLGPHNTFWRLPDFSLIRRVAPPLRRYLAYAFERSARPDFLAAMEQDPPPEVVDRIAALPHNVWETDVWMRAANHRLVRRPGAGGRIVPAGEVKPDDAPVRTELLPCTIDVDDDGQFDFAPTDKPSNFSIFYRADPQAHQAALIEALPELYAGFAVDEPFPRRS